MAASLRSLPAKPGGDTRPCPRPRPGASSFTRPVAVRQHRHGSAAAAAAPWRLQGWWRGRWGPASLAAPALGALEGGGATAPSTAESTDTDLQPALPGQRAQLPGQLLLGPHEQEQQDQSRAAEVRTGASPIMEQQQQQQLGREQQQQQEQGREPPPPPQQQPALQAASSSTSPVYCESDTLSGLLGQFISRQDGPDSGLQLDGLLAYYRRLGCSPQQLQEALQALAPQPPPPLSAAASAAAAGDTTRGAAAGMMAAGAGVGSGAGRASVGSAAAERLWPPTAPTAGLAQQLQLASWELLAAAVAAAAMAAYQSRPYGWSRRDLLEVRQSNIAGRGVFARAPIPAGTVLGSYPGRLRSGAEMLAKCEVAPLAASYAFRTGDGRFLDPTDASGLPSPYPQPGWPWPLPMDVVLSYVNEPPKGSPGTNATVEDGPQAGELLFVASTDIPAGAEVLIDYGTTYDRSGYGRKPGG